MRPLDYNSQQPDGLYARCVCGQPWSEHEDGDCPFKLGAKHDRKYQPDLSEAPKKRVTHISRHDGFQYYEYVAPKEEELFKAEHVHPIRRDTLDKISAIGAAEFPRECCGFIIGPADTNEEEVFAITNTNRYGYGAYTMDPLQQIRVLNMIEQRGWKLKVVFHSHPNMDAFFSSIDRAAATSIDPHKPDWPETVWIVMSIRDRNKSELGSRRKGRPQLHDARVYLWNPAITDFSEITLKVVE